MSAEVWRASDGVTFNHAPKPVSIEDEAIFASIPRTATTSLQQFSGGHSRQVGAPHRIWDVSKNHSKTLPCCGLFHSTKCCAERKSLWTMQDCRCTLRDGCPSTMTVRSSCKPQTA